MKEISDTGNVSKIDVEKSFCGGGCPKLEWAKTGYGTKKSSSKKTVAKKSSSKKKVAKKSSKKKSSKKKSSSKFGSGKVVKKKSSTKKKVTKKRTSSKPKSKRTSSKPKRASSKKKTTIKRKKAGAKTEDEVETDVMASVPPALLVAKYGYPVAKALARRGSQQIFRVGSDELANIRQQMAQKSDAQFTQNSENIYNIKGKSRYAEDATADAENVATDADEAVAVGDDVEDIFADIPALIEGFGKNKKRKVAKKSSKKKSSKKKSSKKKSSKKKSTKKGGAKGKKKLTKKKTIKKKPAKKVAKKKTKLIKKKKSVVKRKKAGSFADFAEGVWNGLKSGTQWETHGNTKQGAITQVNPNARPMDNNSDLAQITKFSNAIRTLPTSIQRAAIKGYKTQQQELMGALNAVPSVKQFVLDHQNQTPQQQLMNALNAVPSVKQFVMQHSPLFPHPAPAPVQAPASATSKLMFYGGKNKNKKGGASFFDSIYDVVTDTPENNARSSSNSVDYSNPLSATKALLSNKKQSSSLSNARPMVRSSSAPSVGKMLFFGGAEKKVKHELYLKAEREHKGAKKRYEDEMKGYLADWKYNMIENNNIDMKNKDNVKRLNKMMAQEKADIVDVTKRYILEAEANVYTEMFNRIRTNRPTFTKFNPV